MDGTDVKKKKNINTYFNELSKLRNSSLSYS